MQRPSKLQELRKRFGYDKITLTEEEREKLRGENRALFRGNDHEDYQEFPDQPWRGPKT